jgi:hypothetical protein
MWWLIQSTFPFTRCTGFDFWWSMIWPYRCTAPGGIERKWKLHWKLCTAKGAECQKMLFEANLLDLKKKKKKKKKSLHPRRGVLECWKFILGGWIQILQIELILCWMSLYRGHAVQFPEWALNIWEGFWVFLRQLWLPPVESLSFSHFFVHFFVWSCCSRALPLASLEWQGKSKHFSCINHLSSSFRSDAITVNVPLETDCAVLVLKRFTWSCSSAETFHASSPVAQSQSSRPSIRSFAHSGARKVCRRERRELTGCFLVDSNVDASLGAK